MRLELEQMDGEQMTLAVVVRRHGLRNVSRTDLRFGGHTDEDDRGTDAPIEQERLIGVIRLRAAAVFPPALRC